MNFLKLFTVIATTLAAAVALPSAANAGVGVTGSLNPAFGNHCTAAPSAGTPGSTQPTGNTIQIPIHIDVNLCG